MRMTLALKVALLVPLLSSLSPKAKSHENRINDKWPSHYQQDEMKTTHQLPDNHIQLLESKCSKAPYCASRQQDEEKEMYYSYDKHPHTRRKRVLTQGQEEPISKSLTISLPKNSKCFKVYGSCDCNVKQGYDYDKPYLEFLNVQGNNFELKMNNQEKLLNFNIYPNSFKLCDENENGYLKATHCHTDFRLALKSNGAAKTDLGINSDKCVQLKTPKKNLFKPKDKLYIIHSKDAQNDAFTCLEAFSKGDCKGDSIRIVVPNFHDGQKTGLEVDTEIYEYSGNKNSLMEIRSVRKCSYCIQNHTDGDIADYAKPPTAKTPPETLPTGEPQRDDDGGGGEICKVKDHNCHSIQDLCKRFTLDDKSDCYFYFNNTKCEQQPIVEVDHVNVTELQSLMQKYKKFENWSIAKCTDRIRLQLSSCIPPLFPGYGIEEGLQKIDQMKKNPTKNIVELVLLYVVGSIAVIMFVVVIIMSFMLWRKKKRIREIRNRCVPNKRFGAHHQQRNVHQMDRIEENDYVSDITGLRALCASFADGYEIPRDQINIGNMRDSSASIIGVGEFSIAFKGQLEPQGRTVAVKTMKTGQATTRTIKEALRECQIFKQLGKHPGILEFLGVSTENASKGEIFIVMAWCEKGSLRGFLAQQKSHFVSLVQDGEWVDDEKLKTALESKLFIENGPPVKFNTIQLFKWCLEIAEAMEFLAMRKIVHVSLSARNVLLDEKFSCKISDFHFAKVPGDVIPSGAFGTLGKNLYKQERLVPWRWYAIESLMDDVFSTQSDVWGFGVVMWEVFSLGAIPYQEYSYGSEFTLCIKHGYRLQTPNFATVECYQLMLMCWYDAPEKRPSFTKLKSKLTEMIPEKNIPISPGPFQIVRSLSKSS